MCQWANQQTPCQIHVPHLHPLIRCLGQNWRNSDIAKLYLYSYLISKIMMLAYEDTENLVDFLWTIFLFPWWQIGSLLRYANTAEMYRLWHSGSTTFWEANKWCFYSPNVWKYVKYVCVSSAVLVQYVQCNEKRLVYYFANHAFLFQSRKRLYNCKCPSVCLSIIKTTLPLRIITIGHHSNHPSCQSAIMPISHHDLEQDLMAA